MKQTNFSEKGKYTLDEIKKLNVPREQVKILVSSEIEFELEGDWPNVTALEGVFRIRGKAKFPELRTTINGGIKVLENGTFNAPKCESIEGYVAVEKNSTFKAPKCESIGGYVEVYENSTFEAPECESIDGFVWVRKNGTFKAPECKSIDGNVRVHKTATFDAPKWKPEPRFTISELQSFGTTVEDIIQKLEIKYGRCRRYSLDQTSFPRQHPAEYAKVRAYLKDDKLSKVPMKELIEKAKAEVKAEKVRGMVMHGPENSQGKGKGMK